MGHDFNSYVRNHQRVWIQTTKKLGRLDFEFLSEFPKDMGFSNRSSGWWFQLQKKLVIENHRPISIISMVEYKYLKPPTVDNIEMDQQTWGIGWSKHQTLGLFGLGLHLVFDAEKLDALAAIWIDQVKEHRGIGAGSLELHLAALLPFRGQRLGEEHGSSPAWSFFFFRRGWTSAEGDF